MASTALENSLLAVSMMGDRSGKFFLISLRHSMPLMTGISRSRITARILSESRSAASFPFRAEMTSNPAFSKIFCRMVRMTGSSSATRILPRWGFMRRPFTQRSFGFEMNPAVCGPGLFIIARGGRLLFTITDRRHPGFGNPQIHHKRHGAYGPPLSQCQVVFNGPPIIRVAFNNDGDIRVCAHPFGFAFQHVACFRNERRAIILKINIFGNKTAPRSRFARVKSARASRSSRGLILQLLLINGPLPRQSILSGFLCLCRIIRSLRGGRVGIKFFLRA